MVSFVLLCSSVIKGFSTSVVKIFLYVFMFFLKRGFKHYTIIFLELLKKHHYNSFIKKRLMIGINEIKEGLPFLIGMIYRIHYLKVFLS